METADGIVRELHVQLRQTLTADAMISVLESKLTANEG